MNAELAVSLFGVDDTFLQSVHKQHSNLADEIVWDAAFEDILEVPWFNKKVFALVNPHKDNSSPDKKISTC